MIRTEAEIRRKLEEHREALATWERVRAGPDGPGLDEVGSGAAGRVRASIFTLEWVLGEEVR